MTNHRNRHGHELFPSAERSCAFSADRGQNATNGLRIGPELRAARKKECYENLKRNIFVLRNFSIVWTETISSWALARRDENW